MKVHRERFLILVTALAAGCHDGGPPAEAPEPPVRWSPAASPTGDASFGFARPRPAPNAEGGHTVPSELGAKGEEQGGDDPFTKEVAGERCNPWLNMHGFPGSCAALAPPGPTCEGFDSTKSECTSMRTHFKPRVAAKAIDCVLAKSKSPDLCSANVNGLCVYEALASVCVEPAAAAVCVDLVKDCADIHKEKLAQAPCEAAWSALRETDRPKFIACMSETCSFASCLPFP